ncbi:MAG: sulfatase family protein, partial [Solirubrobacterales bacterium]
PAVGAIIEEPVAVAETRTQVWRVVVSLALTAGAFAALGTAAAAAERLERPNVIVVLTDDQPYESLARMPHVNGRSDWIRFENAFLNNPVCCPSRATLLDGRYSHRNGVETNFDGRLFDDHDALPVWLKRAGYRTGFFGKYLNGYPWGRKDGLFVPRGWRRWLAFNRLPSYFNYELNQRGDRQGRADRLSRGSLEKHYSTDLLARKATRFIDRSARRAKPFFALLSLYAPHGPSVAAPRHEGAFAGSKVEHPPNFNEDDVSDKPQWIQALQPTDPEAMAEARRGQYRQLLAVDDAVRGIFTSLREARALRETVVIYLSDNGFLWGEHRDVGKACAYEECIRTPLLIRAPKIAGRSEGALVSNVDLAPTIARWAGARLPRFVDGLNLRKLIRGDRDRVRSEVLLRGRQAPPPNGEGQPPSFWGVRSQRFKYVETPLTGELELYDLKNDPFELENVARRAGYATALDDLDAELNALRGFEGPP